MHQPDNWSPSVAGSAVNASVAGKFTANLCVVDTNGKPIQGAELRVGTRALLTYVLRTDPCLAAVSGALEFGRGDKFGSGVALSMLSSDRHLLVVGAPWEGSDAAGVLATTQNLRAPQSRAASLWSASAGETNAWTQHGLFKGDSPDEADQLGGTMWGSGDGDLADCPASEAIEHNGSLQVRRFHSRSSVALSGDLIASGAYCDDERGTNGGTVYLFR